MNLNNESFKENDILMDSIKSIEKLLSKLSCNLTNITNNNINNNVIQDNNTGLTGNIS